MGTVRKWWLDVSAVTGMGKNPVIPECSSHLSSASSGKHSSPPWSFCSPALKASVNMGSLDYWNKIIIIIMDICLEQIAIISPENFCLKQITVPKFFSVYPPVGSKPNCKLVKQRQV